MLAAPGGENSVFDKLVGGKFVIDLGLEQAVGIVRQRLDRRRQDDMQRRGLAVASP